jgi:hypothetical protein
MSGHIVFSRAPFGPGFEAPRIQDGLGSSPWAPVRLASLPQGPEGDAFLDWLERRLDDARHPRRAPGPGSATLDRRFRTQTDTRPQQWVRYAESGDGCGPVERIPPRHRSDVDRVGRIPAVATAALGVDVLRDALPG